MIESDSFKVKKLNPGKLYKAIQTYYYDCLTSKDPELENKKIAGSFNKTELSKLLKCSKDGAKVHKMFAERKSITTKEDEDKPQLVIKRYDLNNNSSSEIEDIGVQVTN